MAKRNRYGGMDYTWEETQALPWKIAASLNCVDELAQRENMPTLPVKATVWQRFKRFFTKAKTT